MIKPHIIFDNTVQSKKIKKILDNQIKNSTLIGCNLIIVIGADGIMLAVLKK